MFSFWREGKLKGSIPVERRLSTTGIGADAVVFENRHEDKVQLGIAAASRFDHFGGVFAVKLVSAGP